MLLSEGHPHEAGWFATAAIGSKVEMGRDKYVFYYGTSHYSKRK
jgi:hypothetical protein